jgi:hypothetical protein
VWSGGLQRRRCAADGRLDERDTDVRRHHERELLDDERRGEHRARHEHQHVPDDDRQRVVQRSRIVDRRADDRAHGHRRELGLDGRHG